MTNCYNNKCLSFKFAYILSVIITLFILLFLYFQSQLEEFFIYIIYTYIILYIFIIRISFIFLLYADLLISIFRRHCSRWFKLKLSSELLFLLLFAFSRFRVLFFSFIVYVLDELARVNLLNIFSHYFLKILLPR